MRTERLDFAELLAALCGLLGAELDVLVHQPGWEFAIGIHAQLQRVTSLPPERGAITLEFEAEQSLTLVPSEVIAYRSTSPQTGGGEWMELQLGFGGVVTIESLPARDRGPTNRSAS